MKDRSEAEGVILSRPPQFDIVIREHVKKESVEPDCPHLPVLYVLIIFMTDILLNNKCPRLTSKYMEAAAIQSQQLPKGQQKFPKKENPYELCTPLGPS